MDREVERSGPSVEEALEAALKELGASEQEVQVRIVQEARSGFLGVGSQQAVVRVRLKAPGPEASEEGLAEQGEIAAEFLDGLLARMGVPATIEPELEGGAMYVDILGAEPEGEDMGLLIGRYGQTLEALQELTRVAVGRRLGVRCRVVVDVEDYKKRQRSRLAAKAREVAMRVAKTGREEELEPMNPYERKIVHDAVSEVAGVESTSRGEDPGRRVVVRRRR
ncbi:MAG: RNA-binding cell elongation regulator Jag/EloR [Actinomycetota bacterium]